MWVKSARVVGKYVEPMIFDHNHFAQAVLRVVVKVDSTIPWEWLAKLGI